MANTVQIIMIGACGRMGQTICELVKNEPGFELTCVVDRKAALTGLNVPCKKLSSQAEAFAAFPDAVAIDFTAAAVAMESAVAASKTKTPLVIGTTGFDQSQLAKLVELAQESPIFWSANMSIGINTLAYFLPKIAAALGPNYDLEIVEIHHKHKKDAPSGTALLLGEALAESRGWNLPRTMQACRQGLIGERPHEQIGIQAVRGGDVVGIHSVYFLGPGEIIEIKHQAESRANFGQGALRAAAWLKRRKPGQLYSMSDVIAVKD